MSKESVEPISRTKSLIEELQEARNLKKDDRIMVPFKLTVEENAKIQDVADYFEISRQDLIYKAVKAIFENWEVLFNNSKEPEEKKEEEIPSSTHKANEKRRYFIFNTYKYKNRDFHNFIMENKAIALFYDDRKKIFNLNKEDIIFLYESGKGIIAYGEISDNVLHSEKLYKEDPFYSISYKKLNPFYSLEEKPLKMKEVKKIINKNLIFLQGFRAIDKGEELLKIIEKHLNK